MVDLLGPLYLGRVLRVFQFLFTIITMGLALGIDLGFDHPHTTFIFAVTIMTYVWIIPMWFGGLIRWYPAHVIFVGEVLMLIFWLCAMAIALLDYASASCTVVSKVGDVTYTDNDSKCQIGKAMAGFATVVWVFFLVTLGLVVTFIVYPILSQVGLRALWTLVTANAFYPGGVFCGEVYVKTRPPYDDVIVDD